MKTVTRRINADRRLTLGRDLLNHLDIGPGDKIVAKLMPDGSILFLPVEKPDDIAPV